MKKKTSYKMIEREVAVNVNGISVIVTVRAPDNMRQWKLVRLGAEKLGLLRRKRRRRQ